MVVAGRSDYENQVNNVLAFPGVFLAVISGRIHEYDADEVCRSECAVRDG
jgi:malic enzyme